MMLKLGDSLTWFEDWKWRETARLARKRKKKSISTLFMCNHKNDKLWVLWWIGFAFAPIVLLFFCFYWFPDTGTPPCEGIVFLTPLNCNRGKIVCNSWYDFVSSSYTHSVTIQFMWIQLYQQKVQIAVFVFTTHIQTWEWFNLLIKVGFSQNETSFILKVFKFYMLDTHRLAEETRKSCLLT